MLTVPAVLALLAAAYWLFTSRSALRVIRRMPVLEKLSPPEPIRWPKLTLVVAARNEAAELEAALESRLREDYPDLELVVVNDRSTDATGEILDRVAARDRRVVPIHVKELPAGWLGKLHAMHRGLERASGEWILFTDADVHFVPGTLRKVVAYAESRGLDHVGALPSVWRGSPVLDAVIAFSLRSLLTSFRFSEVEDPSSTAGAGVGAFNLVRRSAYDRTPGFEWLKMEIGDDMALGQMLKSYGGRPAFINGRRLISLRFYESVRQMTVSVEKGAGIGAIKPPAIIAISLVMAVAEMLPFAAAALPQPPWARALALAVCAGSMIGSSLMNRWQGQPVLSGLFAPFGALITSWMMLRASVLALVRGGVPWRGTFYTLKELHAGSRFRPWGPFVRPAAAPGSAAPAGEQARRSPA